MRSLFLTLALILSLPLPAQASDPQYVELSPSFIGTLTDSGPRIRYLKVDVALRTNDPAAVARIQYHDPLIRNALVSLFSRQSQDSLSGLEAREALRLEALAVVRQTLEEEEGQALVDDLLFTNLITQ